MSDGAVPTQRQPEGPASSAPAAPRPAVLLRLDAALQEERLAVEALREQRLAELAAVLRRLHP
jgi:hypothetical protein